MSSIGSGNARVRRGRSVGRLGVVVGGGLGVGSMKGGLFSISLRCDVPVTWVAYGGAGDGMAMEDAVEASEYDTDDDSLGDTEQEEEEGQEEDNIACPVSILIL